MTVTYLEKHNPAKNQRRFYAMEVVPNLFGEFSLFKAWGRIGKRGRSQLEWYSTEAEAETALQTMTTLKRRKGYCLEPTQLPLF